MVHSMAMAPMGGASKDDNRRGAGELHALGAIYTFCLGGTLKWLRFRAQRQKLTRRVSICHNDFLNPRHFFGRLTA